MDRKVHKYIPTIVDVSRRGGGAARPLGKFVPSNFLFLPCKYCEAAPLALPGLEAGDARRHCPPSKNVKTKDENKECQLKSQIGVTMPSSGIIVNLSLCKIVFETNIAAKIYGGLYGYLGQAIIMSVRLQVDRNALLLKISEKL